MPNSDKMLESETPQMSIQFLEKSLREPKPARCVDGRPANDSETGPQMLGGSIHPIVLSALFNNSELNRQAVVENISRLQEKGDITGAHRDEKANDDTSGCGFADKLPDILKTAQERRTDISARLTKAFEENRSKFTPLNLPPFETMLDHAYRVIDAYDPEKIKIKGEPLVKTIQSTGARVETVQGDHAEQVAYVNINPVSTLDTNALNLQGHQAFNLDATQAAAQAKILGVPETFSVPASLILYQATEMVLVENKGKPALQVHINS